MTGRARRHQHSQQVGFGCQRAARLGTVVAAIILGAGANRTLAAHAAQAGPSEADAVVAKLRELPLPVRPFQRAAGSATATPAPLPALEEKRQKVYDELHALGPPSVLALARALRDPDPEMRRDVAVALDVVGGGWWHFADGGSRLDLRPALPALLTALGDSDPGVRAWVSQDISDIGEAAATAVPRLRAMLRNADPQSRGSACSALGRIGLAARGALPDLQEALHDSSPEVRQAARDAITRIDRDAALH